MSLLATPRVVYAEVIPPYGEYLNETVFSAVQGWRDRGVEVKKFEHETTLLGPRIPNLKDLEVTMETLVVGSIGAVRQALEQAENRVLQNEAVSSYPSALMKYLHREVRKTKVSEVLAKSPQDLVGKFVKPVQQKLFTGKVMNTLLDLVTLYQVPPDTEIWVSDSVDFLLEVRHFVVDGEVVGAQHYRGDPTRWGAIKAGTVAEMVKSYYSQPRAWSLDVGVVKATLGDRAVLVEVNDGFALGHYGLPRHLYSMLLWTRWLGFFGSRRRHDPDAWTAPEPLPTPGPFPPPEGVPT